MILPLQLTWIVGIVILVLLLVVLLEIHRSNFRREHEVMDGTDVFNEGVRALGLSSREVVTLEKLVRTSKFENKDAVLNSSLLFESAVTDFYDIHDVFSVSEGVLDSVESLREILNFTASNEQATVLSTRQFNVGDRIDVIMEDGCRLKHSEIVWRNEKEWAVQYDGSQGPSSKLVGTTIRVRWTRPEDAVYSTLLKVRSAQTGELVVGHSSTLEKQQLRRWVREIVDFPVEATLADGTTCGGVLYDLSAGGIMIGLPVECFSGQHIHIRFDLPSFGRQDVEIEILRSLGHKNPDYPSYFSQTASFTGAFGWTQERVLQYIFEVHKARKNEKT